MAADPKIVVKKVQAYPFECTLRIQEKFIPAQVVRLVEKGLMVEVGELRLSLRTQLDIRLKIPASENYVDTAVEVIKVYDRMDPQTKTLNRLIEFHFVQLPVEQKRAIREFIQKLNANKMA